MENVKVVSEPEEDEEELQFNLETPWHDLHSAWIFIGGLPYDLTEGDITSVFSQYGEIVTINLLRDKGNGKSRGFCFLCYEDQKSTILAIQNLNGIKLLGRTIRVDHVAPPLSGFGRKKSLTSAKRQRMKKQSPATYTRHQDEKRNKKTNDSIQQSTPVDPKKTVSDGDITTSRDLQVVFMGSQEGGPITQEDVQLIKKLLIAEIERKMKEPPPRSKPLVFEGCEYQKELGWFILTCCNEETSDWILDWQPNKDCRFVAKRSVDAPWSTRIVVGLGSEVGDLDRFIKLVEYQNPGLLGANKWKFLGTEGDQEHLRAIFRVPDSSITWFEEHGWRMLYELDRVLVWRAPPIPALPSTKQDDGGSHSQGD